MHLIDNGKDNQDQCREETERLKRVGEYQRTDTATTGVEPDEQHHHHDIHSEWDASWGEHKLLQDDADHVESDCRTCHLRQQEETGACQIGPLP